MEHARHVFRIALVVIVLIVAVTLGRTLLVPRSYGMYGPYRADNVAEQASVRLPQHGGAEACGDCHADQAKKRAAGSHKNVSCEICHGPLGKHVVDAQLVADMPVDRSYGLCARCHRKIVGRPEKFPQVVLDQHVPMKLEGAVCLECHDPHSPRIGK